ncbi:MAG: serine/threonine-protein kinase [Polyangiaceae bacterium]
MQDWDPALIREGDLLAGKYRIERVLGAGGMAVVVAARHVQLQQLVAIKLLKPESLRQPGALERFLREARAVARLRSEHVSRVLDVGTLESGAPYMVMEFLEGRDLSELLNERGPLPLELSVSLVHQACKGLGEAHALGIVHRDVKPQNLFLTNTPEGTPRLKVLDFGISKSNAAMEHGWGSLTQTHAILGSPLYMAPEQMRSSRLADARSDVWALGVVLFELLTKRWPFEADELPELCLKVVSTPPLSLSQLRPDVPSSLVAVVERCLAKSPDERFESAVPLGAALEAFARRAPPLEVDADPTIVTEPPFGQRPDSGDWPSRASLLSSAPPSTASIPPTAPARQTQDSWGKPSSALDRRRALWPLLWLGVVAFASFVVLGVLVGRWALGSGGAAQSAFSVAASASRPIASASVRRGVAAPPELSDLVARVDPVPALSAPSALPLPSTPLPSALPQASLSPPRSLPRFVPRPSPARSTDEPVLEISSQTLT